MRNIFFTTNLKVSFAAKGLSKLLEKHTSNFSLEPVDQRRLATLCGQFNEHLRQVESYLNVEILNRGHHFQIIGQPHSVNAAGKTLNHLYQETAGTHELTPSQIYLALQENKHGDKEKIDHVLLTKRGAIKARGTNQSLFLNAMQTNTVNFGIGPAGTGKTFLAIAAAVQALEQGKIKRIILVRPVVEAGEHLGFLPGDLAQKVDPYLRPMYDALYELMGAEKVVKCLERNIIEIAPLAYMRGRTLSDCFVILDEAQNTTREQMKMFLTRIGFASTAVITGDVTQIDLPGGKESGLKQAIQLFRNIDGISFTFFEPRDIVRHPLIEAIVAAYDKAEKRHKR